VKLVIADDESLVRISLTSMIKEMEAAWHIVGEAANGEELLALLAEHKPNIAIVDIRMPKLTGLEAIRLGKEISPLTHWIILTAYTDFAYAQQAIKLGASEYLVKPVNPVELERVLLSIYRDNKEYIALLNQQFENHISALCNHLASLKTEQRGSLFHRGRFIGWMFTLDTGLPVDRTAALECAFCERLREQMHDCLAYGMNAALTVLPNSELAVIAAWDPDKGTGGKRRVHDFLQAAADLAAEFSSKEAQITILASEECAGFEALNQQLQHLQQWAELRCLCGIGRMLAYADLAAYAEVPGMLETGLLLTEIGQHLKNRMYLNYQQSVSAFETLLHKHKWLESGWERAKEAAFLRTITGLDLTEADAFPDVIRQLRLHGEQVLRDKCLKQSSPADLVEQVIRYVDKHYMDDISIGRIAADLDVSATYLSSSFHKKTGVPYVKYLTRIRMYKAKELLLETNLQVKQIAEQVGYYSTRHFTKLFTEAFGSYPSDYRKMQQSSAAVRQAAEGGA
jgi:two-component system response regulator YesN